MEADLKHRFDRSPGVFGETTVFGQMPDWNPAELLGKFPRPLAISLYEQLITEKVWSVARFKMGYSTPNSQSLMSIFAGQPFIDVRLSLNSFLPQGLPSNICEGVIDHWVSNLVKKPEKHDKIEFDIAITAFTFDIDSRIDELIGQSLSVEDKITFKEYLERLTKNLILGGDQGSITASLKKIKTLDSRNITRKQTGQTLADLASLIAETIEYGTEPFAILARHAFIATAILESLRNTKLATPSEIEKLPVEHKNDRIGVGNRHFSGP